MCAGGPLDEGELRGAGCCPRPLPAPPGFAGQRGGAGATATGGAKPWEHGQVRFPEPPPDPQAALDAKLKLASRAPREVRVEEVMKPGQLVYLNGKAYMTVAYTV